MNISEPFIRRPIGTSLLAAGLLLLGVAAYFALPIAPLPQVEFPTISVSANLPGVDPATAASAIAAPLERRLGQIPGVTEMTSSSSNTGSNISIQFDLDRNIDDAARDVQAAINAAMRDLQGDLPNPPSFRKHNPADAPVIVLALTSDTMTTAQIYDLADQLLLHRLSELPGISQVTVTGGAKTAVRVQVNPAALSAMGLTMDDVRDFLQKTNRLTPKGSIENDGRNLYITVNDQIFGADNYKSLVVGQKNGSPVRLGDIASVIESNENLYQAGWRDRSPAVLMQVMKRPDANVIQVVDEVKALIPQLSSWLPPSVKLHINSDRTTSIRAAVHEVQFTMVFTIGLVILVVALFLKRFWPTFIAGITVPLALGGTFAVMWLWGFSLDNVSLMGLTVAVGFLVDDAIVVIENNIRLLDEGKGRLEAALMGAKQIGFTIVSISVSLVAVFIPIFLMGGIIGRFFFEFAVTVSAAILISAVISLTVTPSLCARFLKRGRPLGKQRRGPARWINDFYARTLRWVLRHRILMQIVTILTIVGTVQLYKEMPKGFFPQQDNGLLVATTEAAQDISFPAMEEKHMKVVDIILADPAVESVASFMGSGRSGGANNGRLFITLKPQNEREDITTVAERLRDKGKVLPGVNLWVSQAQDVKSGGRSSDSTYQFTLKAAYLNELLDWAPKFLDMLRNLPEIEQVTSDLKMGARELTIVIDRNAAGRLGIQPDTVNSVLYSAFGQRQVSVMYGPQNQYRVILEAEPEFREGPASLDKIFIKAKDGQMVPLSAIAHYESRQAPLAVAHQGQYAAITFSYEIAPDVPIEQATAAVDKAVLNFGFPETITASSEGSVKLFKSTVGAQPILILTALIVVYIVLGMLYESLIHPITIISTLPSAGLGALLALQLRGMELSIVALIGIILLIGIVKKNAILMVDFALEAQRGGLPPEEAIYQACIVRFRPILMTTLAALFGALPLAVGMGLGSEMRQPLGVAIVGGLIVSQVLTLYTTPVVYLGMERMRNFVRRLFRRRDPRGVAPLPA